MLPALDVGGRSSDVAGADIGETGDRAGQDRSDQCAVRSGRLGSQVQGARLRVLRCPRRRRVHGQMQLQLHIDVKKFHKEFLKNVQKR